MIYHVTVSGRTWEVELGPDGVAVDGRAVEVDLARIDGSPTRSLVVDGASHRLSARRVEAERWDLHMGGRRLRAHVVDERTRIIREMTGGKGAASGPRPITAPMPGMVVKVDVKEGDTVHAGQGVVIVEAMKMENELKADAEATVLRVLVAEGEAVDKDQLLVDLGPPAAPEGGAPVATGKAPEGGAPAATGEAPAGGALATTGEGPAEEAST